MDTQLILDSVLHDYDNSRVIDNLKLKGTLDKKSINRITDNLVKILYYGFYENNGKEGLECLVMETAALLKRAVERSCQYSENKIDVAETVEEFFIRIPKVREYLDTDLTAIFDGDPAAKNKEEIIFAYPGFYAISVHRLAHQLFDLNVPLIPRIMAEYAHSQTGIDIHPGATIGKYFCIDHGTGIVIGETTIVGEHVKLYQGVTLGALSTRGGQKLKGVRRHPSLGDNVTVYANAAILGNIVVGNNSTIGSSAFIIDDVKEGSKVSINLTDLHKTISR